MERSCSYLALLSSYLQDSAQRERADLALRLRARRAEIEETALARVRAIDDLEEAADPSYVEGLRTAVEAALEYGIAAIEQGGEREPPIPLVLLAQARNAARNGVKLETVLRRYLAGYSLLSYFLVEEAGGKGHISGAELQRLVASLTVLFDRLLAAIGEEHRRESETLRASSEQRRTERIERLLAGELLDTSPLAYPFDGWHVGVVAGDADVEPQLRDIVADLDCRLLLLGRQGGSLWAWFGARSRLDPADVLRAIASHTATGRAVAVGEPGEGLGGWRLTHRQAAVALPVAQRGPESAVRYADVVLLATALQDDLLAASLRQLYLAPLERDRDGGEVARRTLRAYIAAEGQTSSAAAALGVNRNTVANRVHAIEARIGRSLASCRAEFETALRLDEL